MKLRMEALQYKINLHRVKCSGIPGVAVSLYKTSQPTCLLLFTTFFFTYILFRYYYEIWQQKILSDLKCRIILVGEMLILTRSYHHIYSQELFLCLIITSLA